MTICLRYAGSRAEAEDMMQEGFVAIFKSIGQYKYEGSFAGWMTRIIVNAALIVLRKNKFQFAEVDETRYKYQPIDAYAYSHLSEDDLLKLINALPKGYKVVFNLSVIEGYSHEEIADMLGIQPATSRSQLVKARKMLQQQIVELQKIAV